MVTARQEIEDFALLNGQADVPTKVHFRVDEGDDALIIEVDKVEYEGGWVALMTWALDADGEIRMFLKPVPVEDISLVIAPAPMGGGEGGGEPS
ncbi:MAG: hypothetical protein DWQ49_08940 [Bacteroidetes bacterium]|nr:MAG: hypothetical protein DWQ49_08940 [Bacteroidota bacterium]